MIAEEIELLRYLPLIYEELHPQRLSGKAKRTSRLCVLPTARLWLDYSRPSMRTRVSNGLEFVLTRRMIGRAENYMSCKDQHLI